MGTCGPGAFSLPDEERASGVIDVAELEVGELGASGSPLAGREHERRGETSPSTGAGNPTTVPNDNLHVHRRTRSLALALVLAFCCLSLAGCSAAGTAGAGTRTKMHEVGTRVVPGLGKILVDGRGYTLYAYVPDKRGASKCAGECAFDWPPLLLPHGARRPAGGVGVDTALLGTTKRPNGSLQITYNHWPLYRYRNDVAAGEVTGQGDDMGLWYVITPRGALDYRLLTARSNS
jgi:predicted lipoprotein with Yx(FWY)xxD motif